MAGFWYPHTYGNGSFKRGAGGTWDPLPDIEFSSDTNMPQIAGHNKAAKAGYQLNLSGSNWTVDTVFKVTEDNNRAQSAINSADECTILQRDDQIASIALPSGLSADRGYLLWAQNNLDAGQPIYLNKAEVWWCLNEVYEGATLYIYGRNLTSAQAVNGEVKLTDSGSTEYTPTITRANQYTIEVTVPAMATGSATVEVRNGLWGDDGWSSFSFTVVAQPASDPTIYDVTQSPYNAAGDGVTDDFTAIDTALRAAILDPGSTLYFPNGTYLIGNKLWWGNATLTWEGESESGAIIKASNTFSADSMVAGFMADNVTVKNLTFESVDDNVNTSGTFYQALNFNTSSDCTLDNVTIDIIGRKCVDAAGSTRFTVKNCVLIGDNTFLDDNYYTRFDNCLFRTTRYSNASLSAFGSQHFAMTNCTFQHYDDTDPTAGLSCKGRMFVDQAPNGVPAYNQYFENCVSQNFTPAWNDVNGDGVLDSGEIDLNSGEQLLWETSNSNLVEMDGVSTSGLDVTLNGTVVRGSVASIEAGWYITIIDGTGFGQSRRVTNRSGSVVTVHEAFRVNPDTNSVVCVQEHIGHAIVYDCDFDGQRHAPAWYACSGPHCYHGATDLVIDTCTFNELNYGIAAFTGFDPQNAGPLMFAEFRNNTFNTCVQGISFTHLQGRNGCYIGGVLIENNTFTHMSRNAIGFLHHPWQSNSTSYDFARVTGITRNTYTYVDDEYEEPSTSPEKVVGTTTYLDGTPTINWLPSNDSGILFAYDVTDLQTVTLSSNTIAQLADISGNNRLLYSHNSNPTRKTQGSMSASGTSAMRTGSLSVQWNRSPWCFVAVSFLSANTAERVLITARANVGTSNGPQAIQIATVNWTANDVAGQNCSTAFINPNQKLSFTAGALTILSFVYDGATNIDVYENGTLEGTATNLVVGALQNQERLWVLNDANTQAAPWTDDLFCLALSQSVTDADRQKLEGWAAWTVYQNTVHDAVALLPGGHPYKSTPPTV